MPAQRKQEPNLICCQRTNCISKKPEFYKTYSGLYSMTGYLPICKDCLARLFNSYINKYGDNRKAMQRVCMAFDLYYSDKLFDACGDKVETMIGNYIRMLNMTQNKGKTYDDTIEEGLIFSLDPARNKRKKGADGEKEEEEKPTPEDIAKWGPGLSVMDYKMLNSHYQYLKSSNPDCDSNQEIFINDLCYTKMQQMRAVREGRVDDYNKLTDSYRRSFKDAGLKMVKDSNINEGFSFGVTAETIEKYTPAEYYKDKTLYKDSDNLGGYIERFLYRPLRNLMHGTNDRDFEFFVKDEVEEDGYTDSDE